MREIRTSGLMSGEGKRGDAVWPKLPRLSSTLLVKLSCFNDHIEKIAWFGESHVIGCR
jgi:hypothetical protein